MKECLDETRNPQGRYLREIYVVIEPFMNMDIERPWGNGVITHRSIYVTTYIRHTIWDRKAEITLKMLPGLI